MAVITPAQWMTYANRTFTSGQLAQLTSICTAVDSAVKKYLGRTLEFASYSFVRSAPRTNTFQLFKWTPIYISSFTLSWNPLAFGDPSQFPTGSLLTPYIDYLLQPSDTDPTISSNGVVENLRGGVWGVNYTQPVYSVSSRRINNPGALLVTFNGGYQTNVVYPAEYALPPEITEACCIVVSMILQTPRYGLIPLGESWNGYSYSLAALIMGLFDNPIVGSLLNPYVNRAAKIG